MSALESLLANTESQKHSGRDITVGIIDKQSTPSKDCPCSHDNAREYGMLIDIGSMGHLYDIDAIAICDVILLGTGSWELRTWQVLQWVKQKLQYLQIAHVFGVKHFIIAIAFENGLSVKHDATYYLYIKICVFPK